MIHFKNITAESVHQIATVHDTHSIKGVMAAIRFMQRYPQWDENIILNALNFHQCLNGPRIQELISNNLINCNLPSSQKSLQYIISQGLLPLAYKAGITWYNSSGINDIIMSFKQRAVTSIYELGHAWTIWCSFYELMPFLQSKEEEKFAVERFVEFAANQFGDESSNGSHNNSKNQINRNPEKIEFPEILKICLNKPGFLGHNLLTLGYLQRHKVLLTNAEYLGGLRQIKKMVEYKWNNTAFDFCLPEKEANNIEIERINLESVLSMFLKNGLKDVHTLTVADVVFDIWNYCNTHQKKMIVLYVEKYFRRVI